MKINHRAARFGLAALIVAALTIGVGTPAQAVSNGVTPLSVLPSQIVSGTAPTTGGPLASSSAVRMAQVYKFLTAPSTVAALKAQSAGTATKTETDLIAAAARNVKIPTGLGGLTKVAGAAGVAYTGYEVGTWIGSNAAGQITTELWGVDANDLVCQAATPGAGQGFLSFFSGQNCAAFNARADQPVNTDVVPASADFAIKACRVDEPSACLQITGTSSHTTSGPGSEWGNGVDASYRIPQVCFQGGGGSWLGRGGFDILLKSGSIQQATSGYPASGAWWAADFGDNAPSCGSALGWPHKNGPVDQIVGLRGSDAKTWETPAPAAPANPDRYISCDVTGTGPSGFISTAGAMFKETDEDWSKSVPACGALPAGSLPTGTKLVLHTVGGADQVLWSHDTPPETVADLGGKYKTCLTTVCQLILEKNGVSCFDGADCTGWFADSQTSSSTNTYTCKYAGQAVALTECTVYKPSWEQAAQVDGKTLADPVTGEAMPNSANPKEQAATPTPSRDSQVMAPTVPESRTQCFAGAISLNPLDWVVVPLKCTFMPRQSVVDATRAKIATATAASPAGQLQAAMGGWAFTAPSGCGGLRMHVDFPIAPFDMVVGQACPGDPLRPVANVVQWGVGATLVVLGVISIRNSIAGVAAYRGGS